MSNIDNGEIHAGNLSPSSVAWGNDEQHAKPASGGTSANDRQLSTRRKSDTRYSVVNTSVGPVVRAGSALEIRKARSTRLDKAINSQAYRPSTSSSSSSSSRARKAKHSRVERRHSEAVRTRSFVDAGKSSGAFSYPDQTHKRTREDGAERAKTLGALVTIPHKLSDETEPRASKSQRPKTATSRRSISHSLAHSNMHNSLVHVHSHTALSDFPEYNPKMPIRKTTDIHQTEEERPQSARSSQAQSAGHLVRREVRMQLKESNSLKSLRTRQRRNPHEHIRELEEVSRTRWSFAPKLQWKERLTQGVQTLVRNQPLAWVIDGPIDLYQPPRLVSHDEKRQERALRLWNEREKIKLRHHHQQIEANYETIVDVRDGLL